MGGGGGGGGRGAQFSILMSLKRPVSAAHGRVARSEPTFSIRSAEAGGLGGWGGCVKAMCSTVRLRVELLYCSFLMYWYSTVR